MARTIAEIEQSIYAEMEKFPELQPLIPNTSKVSIWRLFTYIIAYIIFLYELVMDAHKAEVSGLIAELKPHTARWYRNKALAFQYGFDLYPDTDIFDNKNHTEEEIEASKIVRYSAVTESESESRLIIKIAGEQGGKLSPITQAEQAAFTAYIEEVRDAGVPITVINYLPDRLYLNVTIKRDPLVLDAAGNAIAPIDGVLRPVDMAITSFLKQLPFNGELSLSKLVDTIQVANGVQDININSASSSWIDPLTNDYGQAAAIYMSKVPESGYFTIEDEAGNYLTVTYVV